MSRFALTKESIDTDPESFIPGDQYLCLRHQSYYYHVLCLPPTWNPSTMSKGAEVFLFDSDVQECLQSCHRSYQPPLVLAAEDVLARCRCSDAREDFSHEVLMRDFARAVRFYLELQTKQPFLLVEISGETDDIEMPKGAWVWLLGYYPKERSIWGEARAVVINSSGCRDFLKPDLLSISRSELEKRFPATPDYWTSPDPPAPGFYPQSLSEPDPQPDQTPLISPK